MTVTTVELAAALDASRARFVAILEPFDETVLRRQHDILMSPLLWDLAHVANYEDLWLVRALGGAPTRTGIDDLYDAFQQPRNVREALPLLDLASARAYGDAVRGRALELLETADLAEDGAVRLTRDGFVHRMVAQHEHQHAETLLAAIQLLPPEEGHVLTAAPTPTGRVTLPAEVHVPGGTFQMGSADPAALDNERPVHEVDVAAFWIDAAPVTNGQHRHFVEDGGYDEPRWWTDSGWKWRQEAALVAPQFWRRDRDGWTRLRFGTVEPLPDDEPVQHVGWYEADAYARWAGRRLPTEAEWEKAAVFDPVTGQSRRWPWGDGPPTAERANLGQRHLGPAPVGAYPDGVSPVGCHQMIGDVWEWTSSDFRAYPGFEWYPYAEYSAAFYGRDHKVLRGSSWATDATVGRSTFRNWDFPIRRQIFAGFRTARDG
ncbi:MAG: ergothioneine biosynthesis protein EgtB [Acidimicrobiales bacterium]